MDKMQIAKWAASAVVAAVLGALFFAGKIDASHFFVGLGLLGLPSPLQGGRAGAPPDDPVPPTQRNPNESPKPPRIPPVGLAMFALLIGGCSMLAAEKSAAETTYLSQQLKCVDDNQTKRDIDSCRAAVKQQWAIADAATDADGAK